MTDYPPTWYWADSSFMSSGRYKLVSPSYMQIDIGGFSYILTNKVELDLSNPEDWDTIEKINRNLDPTVAKNRAGKGWYIYACQSEKGSLVFKISPNSTVPFGYNADTSRKIGGFHTLCLSVGDISGHPASGYVTGDIVPNSVWDLKFRAFSSNEGMAYVDPINLWVDIYLTSGTVLSTSSVFNGVISDTRTWMDFVDDGKSVKKRLLKDFEFQILASGSNEGTNASSGSDQARAGGHIDTSGRRMISDYFLEDCCGVMWQWLDEQSYRFDNLSIIPGKPMSAWSFKDVLDGKGQIYSQGDYGDVKVRAGGAWYHKSFAGSRARRLSGYRWVEGICVGARFASGNIVK